MSLAPLRSPDAPLCPDLYRRLERAFGDVAVANAGEEMVLSAARPIYTPADEGDDQVVVSAGEYYRVRCPFCADSDRKKRLWISHRWAEFPRLAICYHQDCLANRANREDLRMRVLGRVRPVEYRVAPGTRESAHLGHVAPPGPCSLLSEVDPSHPAAVYVRRVRGYDPAELAARYGVGVCHRADDPRHHHIVGRVYCPVVMRGVLVGWQGRYPADVDWKATGVIKYFTMPGFAKRLALYNYDQALRYPVVVVREGVTDVWSTGPYAVALLGKTVSPAQQVLLAYGWGRTGGTLVVGLDGDAALAEDRGLGALRHAFSGRVVVVTLPDDVDPGDMSPEANWDYIAAAAAAQGVPLPFSPSFEE